MPHEPGEHRAIPMPLLPQQLGMVHDLINRCYTEYGLTLNLKDECESHLLDPITHFRQLGGDFWVCTDEEGLVRATVALQLEREQEALAAELKSMYVDTLWRRRGVGRSLTKHVIGAARTAGAKELRLWSDTRFTAAHRMYESLGFRRDGKRDISDSNNSSEWGYVLGLSSR